MDYIEFTTFLGRPIFIEKHSIWCIVQDVESNNHCYIHFLNKKFYRICGSVEDTATKIRSFRGYNKLT